MPKLYGERERLAQPVLDTLAQPVADCACDPNSFCDVCFVSTPVPHRRSVDPMDFMNGYGPNNLPMAIVKLPRFGLRARAKRSYGDWRRKRAERRKAKPTRAELRAAEQQMLKELSESVLRPFRRLVMLVFGGSQRDRD